MSKKKNKLIVLPAENQSKNSSITTATLSSIAVRSATKLAKPPKSPKPKVVEMNSNERVERRRYPRVKSEIPLKIKYDNYDAIGKTCDISCIGAYCTVNKYIPLFSKISIVLLLPLRNPERTNVCSVRCKGAVVRVKKNPQSVTEYNIAIYFNELSLPGKTKLSQYVQQQLWT